MSAKVHIHNVSGSNLELATIGTMMDRNMISYEAFDEAKLMESSEIQKYKATGFIKFLTPEQVAQARADSAKPEPLPESVADLEMEVPKPLQAAHKKLSEGLDILQKFMANANKGPTVGDNAPKKMPTATVVSGNPNFVITDDNGALTGKVAKKTAASNEDPDDEFPKLPPPGMTPKNEPVKRFLGKPPYSQPMSPADQIKYITECADIGILTEIAMLALPGKPRDLARRKLKEVRASLAGIQGV